MRLHNTLTRSIDELKPVKRGEIGLYSCGPTVYDHVHIGNLRAFIFADVLRRTVKLSGFKLKAVMNITDVDDKTIHRAVKDYPNDEPQRALKQVTEKYEELFIADSKAVGIDLSEVKLIRATEQIELMSQLINQIVSKGYGYVAEDGVYFNVKKYASDFKYGVLSNVAVASHTESRINNDEYDKEDARDFALWKQSDEGEPSWEITVNGKTITGRPGWHIECSAMSAQFLGLPFDLHTGGIDLVFPHHENEIAQTKAATGQDLASHFVHNEHLLVDGKKMSKSLGNFYILSDIIAKGFVPLAFRLLILQSHYRTQQNFTWEALAAAENFLRRIYGFADRAFQGGDDKASHQIKLFESEFKLALLEDLNTPQALALISKLIDELDPLDVEGEALNPVLDLIEHSLGLPLTQRGDITMEQKSWVKEREAARESKDFAKSDQLRGHLKAQGIEVLDTPHGARWQRV